MNRKEAYQRKIKAQLTRWRTKFDGLLTQVEKAGAETRARYGETIATLRAKREEAERKLEELKAAGEETWESAKGGVDYAWEDLRRVTETVISTLRQGKVPQNSDEEEIRLIAYYLWENEGRPEGRQAEHWSRAEALWEERHARERSQPRPKAVSAARKKARGVKPATRKAGEDRRS